MPFDMAMHKRSSVFLPEAFSNRGASEGRGRVETGALYQDVMFNRTAAPGLRLGCRLARRPVGEFLFKYSPYIPEHVF